jgi:hypothetical protein
MVECIRPIATACAALLLGFAGIAQGEQREYAFRVLLEDKEIGTHRFLVKETAEGRRVAIEADFAVRILLVPVYSYRHENTEMWRDGCLQRIESSTDDNGSYFSVLGRSDGAEFLVEANEDRARHSGCVMSFAYWDRSILEQTRLLNAQTGDYLDVSVEALGPTDFETSEMAVPAEAYRLQAPEKDVDITLWYAREDGRWLALESRVKSGKTIRYLPDPQAMPARTGSVVAERAAPQANP